MRRDEGITKIRSRKGVLWSYIAESHITASKVIGQRPTRKCATKTMLRTLPSASKKYLCVHITHDIIADILSMIIVSYNRPNQLLVRRFLPRRDNIDSKLNNQIHACGQGPMKQYDEPKVQIRNHSRRSASTPYAV